MRMGSRLASSSSNEGLEVAAGRVHRQTLQISRRIHRPRHRRRGLAGGKVVGYAGMMTEDLEPRIKACPDVTGFPRTEVIIQKSHRYAFDHQIRQTGAKLVEVETREEMIAACSTPRTLAIHFTNILSDKGKVSGPETVEIARAHNIYTFNDASADVPPVSRLWEYPAIGFDMVTLSGGKDICGPQASGILIGKEELIRWSMLNMSPQEDRIGRCCKVGKETIFALLKALEIFVNQNYDATLRMYDARAQVITDATKKVTSPLPSPRQFSPAELSATSPRATAGRSIPPASKSPAPRSCRSSATPAPVEGIGSMGAGRRRYARAPNPDAPTAEHRPNRPPADPQYLRLCRPGRSKTAKTRSSPAAS